MRNLGTPHFGQKFAPAHFGYIVDAQMTGYYDVDKRRALEEYKTRFDAGDSHQEPLRLQSFCHHLRCSIIADWAYVRDGTQGQPQESVLVARRRNLESFLLCTIYSTRSFLLTKS